MSKIKSLRLGLGLSQDELAERAGLSIRTIQRIENGETTARGDSLKRLCQVLGVSIETLKDGTKALGKALDVDHGLLALINLSALAFLIPVPGMGVLAPLTLWLIYRRKIEGADSIGRRMINFQLTWLLFRGLILTAAVLLELGHFSIPGVRYPQYWLFLRVLDAFNINCIVVNAIRAGKGRLTNYAPAIRFLQA